MRGKLRIGGASAFWGDSAVGPVQLALHGEVDYLVFDYLAELTMSILARMRAKDPQAGYATDFIDIAMANVLHEIARRGIKVVSNAGGMNPRACAAALETLARRHDVGLRIAVVEGDDVMPRLAGRSDIREMATGEPVPEKLLSANAYLGALPIAAALGAEADIVITGRCVDSAVTLGALMHEFGWKADDWDLLAAGSLAGHILECGAQATGGLFSDWEDVEDWAEIGYPVAECSADGSFVVTKPPGTGGLVTPATVAEQMLYEIGDPAAYILPDVVCDFSGVEMRQEGSNRVRVTGARGRPSTDTYKVSATYPDGWRSVGTLTLIGRNAAEKARRSADAILARTRAMLRQKNLGDYRRVHLDVLGAESLYGPHSRAAEAREVQMRLVVEHDDRGALEIFSREIAPAGTSWAPGTTGSGAGRPTPAPIVRLFSCLLPKSEVEVSYELLGGTGPQTLPSWPGLTRPSTPAAELRHSTWMAGSSPAMTGEASVTVPLYALAYARSGDKGNNANIGVIARAPEFVPILRDVLTPERVRAYFAHLVEGKVERFELPGIGGFNFVLHEALAGGGMASPRLDPLAKAFGQMLLDMEIPVPAAVAARLSVRGTSAGASP